ARRGARGRPDAGRVPRALQPGRRRGAAPPRGLGAREPRGRGRNPGHRSGHTEARRSDSEGAGEVVLNIPNTLTLLRIAAIPAILIALDNHSFELAFILFVDAGVTDGLDGGIARMTNTRTQLGAYLDPLADKGLVLSLLIKLTLLGEIAGWVLTIILTRDIVCLSGYVLLFFLTGEQIEVRPSMVGKRATLLH